MKTRSKFGIGENEGGDALRFYSGDFNGAAVSKRRK